MSAQQGQEFRARNGMIVRPAANGGIEVGKPGYRDYTTPEATFALEEWFQHKGDLERGRWRYPLERSYVVYADDETVKVFNEATGRTVVYYRYDWPTNQPLEETRIARDAANAYIKEHPERKPWEDAREGDLWDLDGEQYLAVIDTDGETVIGPRFFRLPLTAPSGGRWEPGRFPHEFSNGSKAYPKDAS